MFEKGYWQVTKVGGIPLRLHFTLPIGLLLFSRGRFAPGLWLGILLIIVVHEAGHAAMVRHLGLVNRGIDLTGLGGRCLWMGDASPMGRALVAWGGVWAQLPLLLVAWPLGLLWTAPPLFAAEFLNALVWTNIWLIGLNLLPLPGFDGAEAWPLLPMLKERWGQRRARNQRKNGNQRKSGARKRSKESDNPIGRDGLTLKEALREAEGTGDSDRR